VQSGSLPDGLPKGRPGGVRRGKQQPREEKVILYSLFLPTQKDRKVFKVTVCVCVCVTNEDWHRLKKITITVVTEVSSFLECYALLNCQ